MTAAHYRLRWTEQALKMLGRIRDRRIQRLLLDAGESLKKEPEKKGKPLTGLLRGYRTLRAGGQRYRLIYWVEGKQVRVWILAVGIRKAGDKGDIYRLAQRLFSQGLLRRPKAREPRSLYRAPRRSRKNPKSK